MTKKRRKKSTPNVGYKPAEYEQPPSTLDVEYFLALGRFVEEYASVEDDLFTYLHMHSDMLLETARALLSGVRAEGCVSLIRRLWEVLPPEKDVRMELENAFAQFALIANVRNSVMHYGSFLSDSRVRLTTDVSRAHVKEKIHTHRVSSRDLDAMRIDLEKIGWHLKIAPLSPRITTKQMAKLIPALLHAWSYIPTRVRPPIFERPELTDPSTMPIPPIRPESSPE